MEITEDVIREVLESSKDSIKANIHEAIKKQITTQLSWSLQSEIQNIVDEFVKEKIKDEVMQMLVDSKPILLAELKNGFVKIGAGVAQAMYEKAAKNISVDSYRLSEQKLKLNFINYV